jgi:hypothetical protein
MFENGGAEWAGKIDKGQKVRETLSQRQDQDAAPTTLGTCLPDEV